MGASVPTQEEASAAGARGKAAAAGDPRGAGDEPAGNIRQGGAPSTTGEQQAPPQQSGTPRQRPRSALFGGVRPEGRLYERAMAKMREQHNERMAAEAAAEKVRHSPQCTAASPPRNTHEHEPVSIVQGSLSARQQGHALRGGSAAGIDGKLEEGVGGNTSQEEKHPCIYTLELRNTQVYRYTQPGARSVRSSSLHLTRERGWVGGWGAGNHHRDMRTAVPALTLRWPPPPISKSKYHNSLAACELAALHQRPGQRVNTNILSI